MPDGQQPGAWTLDRIKAEAADIVASADRLSPEQRLGFIKGRLRGLPKEVADCLEPLVLFTERVVRQEDRKLWASLRTWEKVTLFVFGAVFLTLFVIIALFVPNPSAFQKDVFCVGLGISAACIGAILPGLIHIEGRVQNVLVRAAGAIALVVLVLIMCLR